MSDFLTIIAHTRGQLASAADRIRRLEPQGKPIQIRVGVWKKPHRRTQRNYMEAVIRAAAHHFGYNGESECNDFREQLLAQVCGYDEVPVGNRTFRRRRTTRKLNRDDFAELTERVKAFLASECDYTPPDIDLPL